MWSELDDDHVVGVCRVLRDHQVAFVIIGGIDHWGIAARLHDTGYATVDVDKKTPEEVAETFLKQNGFI